MAIIIEKNKEFFAELANFNPKLARILDEEHGWTDKLVHRSDDASISQSTRRRKGTEATGNDQSHTKMVDEKVAGN